FTTVIWRVYSSYPEGTFLGISPSGNATKFSTISLKVSAGPKPEPQPQSEPGATADTGGTQSDSDAEAGDEEDG
ncbi:MAG: hypothetical protein ACK5KO_08810, partial [Arachnia sp.]